jgi:alpha-1,3-mannosyltransferase
VFIGRFSNNKRVDLLVSLFAQLVKIDPVYQLKIIGKDWDGNEAKLRKQITNNQLGSNVEILTGLSDEQIHSTIENSSFVISASDYEGFGLTLIEGMSAGLIPVASSIPSFERIIKNSEQGILIDFESVSGTDFDHKIEQLIIDYAVNRPKILDFSHRYSWNSVSLSFTQYYKQLAPEEYRLIQGVKVINATEKQACEQIERLVAVSDNPVKVAFANAHTINVAQSSPSVKSLLGRFVVLNDGVGLNIASKLKYGKAFKANLNGTDFIPYFLATTPRSYRVFLLGAEETSVSACIEKWKIEYPQHEFVGYENGFYQQENLPEITNRIRLLKTDLLLVAMGNPKQEQWIDEHLATTGAKMGIGVGALFDFTAGKVHRAPEWVRKIKCEWVYRFLQEPKRLFKRYLIGNGLFLIRSAKDNI